MKFKTTQVGGTYEILAAPDFDAIPFTVTETTAVKAGTPMTLKGKKATFTPGASGAAGTTTADGVLLYDVDPAENPNAALVVRGMYETGVSMNQRFRETSEGGLAKMFERRRP